MKKAIIIEIIIYSFIILFIYTSVSKVLKFDTYLYDLNRSPLIGGLAPILSFLLPATEVLISVMLFFTRTRLWGLYGALGLMLVFTLYVAYILSFETNLPCTCGGLIRELSWKQHLVFNIFFTCLAVAGIRLWRDEQIDKTNHNTNLSLG